MVKPGRSHTPSPSLAPSCAEAVESHGGVSSSGRKAATRAAAGIGGGVKPLGETAPLVSSCISQQTPSAHLQIFPQSLRVKRPGTGNPNQTPPEKTAINSFSDHSRRRLRFRALNAFPALVSQFGLTYHNEWPTDGRASKAHLNAWLTTLRRLLPGVGYLWILEFQKRKSPHYHVFLTTLPDPKTWARLAQAWCRITDGTDDQLWWHGPERGENWIAWDMGSGSYLCKYLDKEAQKDVPEGYNRFGRFWGNSRGLEASPVNIPLDVLDQAQVDQETGEIYGGQTRVIRWLGRLAEKQTRGYSRFRTRAQTGSYTILKGASAYKQIEAYFCKLAKPSADATEPPF